MPLQPGTRLGLYEIAASIGAGGMGEVYRARDLRLHRDVAIKVLPELFAADPDRLARFEREAQTLAALNHPHIAQIYGVVESPAALVMELVEGEDLSQRIARGAIPIAEALTIARQVAAALDAAHDRGIIHRDLKPANVKLTTDGTVKVLDFGLAKAIAPQAAPDSAAARNSPTIAVHGTQIGVIVGTAAYMAPEQATGKPVDKRADIWAFGALLFEMLAGRGAFTGDSTTEILGAIVHKEPDWPLIPDGTPSRVRDLLRRCLEKDPKRRLRDIGDAAYELSADAVPPAVTPVRTRGARWSSVAVAAVVALVAAAVTWLAMRAPAAVPAAPRRFAVSGLAPMMFDAAQALALSPDGSALAFRGLGADGVERIYLRDFHSLELRPLAGTDGGRLPFFSPDGKWIAFFTVSALKKVAVEGGPAQTIAPAPGPSGGTWMDDGSIIFTGDPVKGVQRVLASGGTPETLLAPRDGALNAYSAPWGLPGSQALLLLQKRGASFDVAVLSLRDRRVSVLARDAFSPAWAPTGHVLFHQGDSILALSFDPATLTGRGTPFPVAQAVGNRISYQSRLFAVANDGTLAYVPAASAGEAGWAMMLVGRDGRETVAARLDRQSDTPRFSPDGTRVAFRTPAPNCDIWVRDLARGTTTRLTREGDNHGVVWSADGTRVLTGRAVATGTEVVALPADGSGTPEIVATLPGAFGAMPTSLSLTGEVIVQDRFGRETGSDIATIVVKDSERRTLLDSPSDEGGGVISPDDRWLAYVSDESGRNEVYLRPYAGAGPRTLVSISGAVEPVWSRTGNELFFRSGRDLLTVPVSAERGAAAQPRVLFTGDYPVGPQVANYDVAPDGRLMMMRGRQWAEGQVVIVLNWFGRR